MSASDPSSVLSKFWNKGHPALADEDRGLIPKEIQDAVLRCVDVSIKSYRYAAITQLLAKVSDPSRDARAVQELSDLAGSFDARTFCKRHVVPFDREHDNVLGGSGDPYVNNPLRIPTIDINALSAQRNKQGFQDLIDILAYAESKPEQSIVLLKLFLLGVKERLAKTAIVYPVPNRISADAALIAIRDYLLERTGGRRFQALSAAMFDVIGKRFKLYDRVDVGNINRADAAAGEVADLNCMDAEGKTVLAVEVKDRKLNIREVEDKLPGIREAGVGELLFLIRGGIEIESKEAFEKLQRDEFSSGHNIYSIEFDQFFEVISNLLGESGRRVLFQRIGERIDEYGELSDRQAWRDLLMQGVR